MSNDDIMLFISRFNVLGDKIKYGTKLNDIDESLLSILNEYNHYLVDIKTEYRDIIIGLLKEMLIK